MTQNFTHLYEVRSSSRQANFVPWNSGLETFRLLPSVPHVPRSCGRRLSTRRLSVVGDRQRSSPRPGAVRRTPVRHHRQRRCRRHHAFRLPAVALQAPDAHHRRDARRHVRSATAATAQGARNQVRHGVGVSSFPPRNSAVKRGVSSRGVVLKKKWGDA